jgi:hypothetical protein
MKKDELLGMEVFYEDNPQEREPRGRKGVEGVEGITVVADRGIWAFGDSDEEDDFDDIYGESDNYSEEHELIPAIPVKGRIYWVKSLDLVAKLKKVRNFSNADAAFEMSLHEETFYVNPDALFKASEEQVTQYLEESDYNNTP